MGVPEGKDKEKWTENVFKEIMTINYSNLGTLLDIQVQKAQRYSNRFIPEIFTETHYHQALKNQRKRILKTAREKKSHCIFPSIPIRLSADLSPETLQARKDWDDIFKCRRKKKKKQKTKPSPKRPLKIMGIRSKEANKPLTLKDYLEPSSLKLVFWYQNQPVLTDSPSFHASLKRKQAGLFQ